MFMKTIFAVLSMLVTTLLFFNPVKGQSVSYSKELSMQLNDLTKQYKLNYPKSVKRYYLQNGFQSLWIKNRGEAKRIEEAMMLLDCVLQYGLAHADYHPGELTYDNFPAIIDEPEKISIQEKVRFDILLTDAMITLINHLHYGKLNPYFSARKIDGIIKATSFSAVNELAKAIEEEGFTAAILSTQPKSKVYNDLQRYMRLIKGQYLGDCYEVPEAEVRTVAINMERLRWWEFDEMKAIPKKALYLTCEIKDGLPVFYKDSRHLDPSLEAALYNQLPPKKKMPLLLPKIKTNKD